MAGHNVKFAFILWFTYIFVRQTRSNSELEYVISRLSHRVLVIAKALELLMGSRVNTSGDNQNAMR